MKLFYGTNHSVLIRYNVAECQLNVKNISGCCRDFLIFFQAEVPLWKKRRGKITKMKSFYRRAWRMAGTANLRKNAAPTKNTDLDTSLAPCLGRVPLAFSQERKAILIDQPGKTGHCRTWITPRQCLPRPCRCHRNPGNRGRFRFSRCPCSVGKYLRRCRACRAPHHLRD